jgi:hypothetical protein
MDGILWPVIRNFLLTGLAFDRRGHSPDPQRERFLSGVRSAVRDPCSRLANLLEKARRA